MSWLVWLREWPSCLAVGNCMQALYESSVEVCGFVVFGLNLFAEIVHYRSQLCVMCANMLIEVGNCL